MHEGHERLFDAAGSGRVHPARVRLAGCVKRGDIVLVAAPGDDGKPRPAVVIQSDQMRGSTSVLVVLMTSALADDAPLYQLRLTSGQIFQFRCN